MNKSAKHQAILSFITVFIFGCYNEPTPLKIGVIGSGRMGGSVGLRWAEADHEILFSSRHPDQLSGLVTQAGPRARAGYPQEAAEFGDIIFIAVPYAATPQVGRDYGHLMQGKIVIDCGNPYVQRDGSSCSRKRNWSCVCRILTRSETG